MEKKLSLIKLLILLLIFLAPLSTGCRMERGIAGGSLSKIEEKTFNTFPGKSLFLDASYGDVYIKTSADSKVTVRIFGDKRAEKNIQFTFDNNDKGVTVKAEKKDGWHFFSFGSSGNLRFDITLPKSYNAVVNTAGGNIYLDNLNGDVKLKSSGGDLSLSEINGNINAQTSGGDIRIDSTNGNINIGTSGGDIRAESFSGDFDASTSGGNITLDGSNGKINASTSGGEVSLNYSGENKGINLSTSGGSIKIILPSNFNADVKLETSGGSIKCKFKANNITEVTSYKLQGQFNSGGNSLIAKTSGGDIIVKEK